ncbi:MAG: hypothetical protein ABFE07_27130 [Armatimonadia bacterium]
MSELTLFQSGSALPTHLRRSQLSGLTKSLMGGGNSKRISIDNNVFTMMVGGKAVAVNEDRAMNIIIVRAAEANARTYYGGTYEKGVKARPVCWSDNSVTPHEKVKNPQHKSCNGCPQDVKGSGQGDSKACRYSRRLAVLLASDMDGDVYAMNVNASSLFAQGEGRKMGLQQYARFLGGHGIEVNAVVTEMRFDTSANMKLTFSAVRPLEEHEWAKVLARMDDQAAIDAVAMTVADIDGVEEPPAAAAPAEAPVFIQPRTSAPAPAPAPAPAAKTKPKAEPAPAPVQDAVQEPVVREAAKAVAVETPSVKSILSEWADADV